MNTPPTGSESYRRLNPHIFGVPDTLAGAIKPLFEKPPKRIRQSTKPLLNRHEQEYFNILAMQHRRLYTHITFKLCNGLRYTPDIFSFEFPALGEVDRPTAWEIKSCAPLQDDSVAKVKMFAHTFPEIRVILAWKDRAGAWQTQRILP